MIRLTLTFSIVSILLMTESIDAQSDEYVLPDDKSKPVITMQMSGGFRVRPVEKPEPLISIYPDGKVVAGKTGPNVARVEWKMDRKQLQALFKFCIKENNLMEISTESIKKAIADSGQRIMVADAPNTDIMIQTAEKKNRLSVYALYFANNQFGDKIASVRNVSNVEKELKRVHALAVLGGQEKFDVLLKQVNKAMKEKDKAAPVFKSTHLTYAQKTSNGLIRCSFSNTQKDERNQMVASFSAQVAFAKGKKEPTITARAYRRK